MGNLIIAINDFKEDMARCVNKAASDGVPFTVIELVMTNVMSQVQAYAKAELDGAKAHTAKEVVEKENQNDGNGG